MSDLKKPLMLSPAETARLMRVLDRGRRHLTDADGLLAGRVLEAIAVGRAVATAPVPYALLPDAVRLALPEEG